MRSSRINQSHLNTYRKEILYEVIMTDLARVGIIPKDVFEKLTDITYPFVEKEKDELDE